MKRFAQLVSTLALSSLLGSLAVLGGGCQDSNDNGGGGPVVTEAAQIEVDPPSVVFSSAIVGGGDYAVERIRIGNSGTGELRVSSIRLEEDDPVKEFELSYEVPRDAQGNKLFPIDEKEICPPTDNFRLAGVASATEDNPSYCILWVLYRPEDTERDLGRIRIRSNDTVRETVQIDLSTGESKPRLTVSPPTVRFGEVLEGESVTERVTVFNSGRADLVIDRISLANDADQQFEVEISQEEGTHHAYPATLKPAVTVEDREHMVLLVHYTPGRSGNALGKLRIESNDPDNEAYDVPLEALSIKPCIKVIPESVVFGDVAIGEAKEVDLEVSNCGNADLVITEASLVEAGTGTSPDFHIYRVPEGLDCGDGQIACTGEITIPEGGSVTVVMQYIPGEEAPDGGSLLLRTNVPGSEELEIDLFGRGTTNTCPVAIAEARVLGSDSYSEFPDEARRLITIPLKTLELRGENSTDPDGFIPEQGYKWTVVERPTDSTAELAPHQGDPNPTFYVDLAGTYVFELQVTDNKGLFSCQNARVVVEAIPDEDIHIQLVWDTPADPDQTDEDYGAGADVDLHFLHPLGDWFDLTYDCFYGNKTADWGRPGVPTDDPSLDRDDLDGAGPENINLDNPESGRVYRVGVHYFADHGYGASFVTVRIFIEGVLAFELANKRMPSTDYFWDVASISWPSGEIQSIDNLMASTPGDD